jgi:hypothetical protein
VTNLIKKSPLHPAAERVAVDVKEEQPIHRPAEPAAVEVKEKQPNFLDLFKGRASDARPPLSIGLYSFPVQYVGSLTPGYFVLCQSKDPVTIHKVTYNDEVVAPLARRNIYDLVPDEVNNFPVTLSIGEVLYVMKEPYHKQIIFIKVFTDRGVIKCDSRGQIED